MSATSASIHAGTSSRGCRRTVFSRVHGPEVVLVIEELHFARPDRQGLVVVKVVTEVRLSWESRLGQCRYARLYAQASAQDLQLILNTQFPMSRILKQAPFFS